METREISVALDTHHHPQIGGLTTMASTTVQKFLYQLNRNQAVQDAYRDDPHGVLAGFELTDLEIDALVAPDIGLLFVLGVNGQILMHFAAFHQISWADYLQRMRDGVAEHGPVREGVYAMTATRGMPTPPPSAKQPGRSAALAPGQKGRRK